MFKSVKWGKMEAKLENIKNKRHNRAEIDIMLG